MKLIFIHLQPKDVRYNLRHIGSKSGITIHKSYRGRQGK